MHFVARNFAGRIDGSREAAQRPAYSMFSLQLGSGLWIIRRQLGPFAVYRCYMRRRMLTEVQGCWRLGDSGLGLACLHWCKPQHPVDSLIALALSKGCAFFVADEPAFLLGAAALFLSLRCAMIRGPVESRGHALARTNCSLFADCAIRLCRPSSERYNRWPLSLAHAKSGFHGNAW